MHILLLLIIFKKRMSCSNQCVQFQTALIKSSYNFESLESTYVCTYLHTVCLEILEVAVFTGFFATLKSHKSTLSYLSMITSYITIINLSDVCSSRPNMSSAYSIKYLQKLYIAI